MGRQEEGNLLSVTDEIPLSRFLEKANEVKGKLL